MVSSGSKRGGGGGVLRRALTALVFLAWALASFSAASIAWYSAAYFLSHHQVPPMQMAVKATCGLSAEGRVTNCR